MSGAPTRVGPIRRAITVACPVEHAFRTFTEDMSSWWPLETYSIGIEEDGSNVPEGVVMEPRAGGKFHEVGADGSTPSWGRVLVWEPPHRVVLEWQPGAKHPTEVEVRFMPDGDVTRVELEHRGWEIYGEVAEQARDGYANGWPGVLERYAYAAGSSSR